jgi:hypothetical protein
MSIAVSGWRRIPEKMRELAFQFWVESGSLTVASKKLNEMGYVNSNGKPFAVSQVSAQANTYLLENFRDKPLIDAINQDRAKLDLGPLSQEEFEKLLVHKAVVLWGKKTHVARFWDWVERYDFWKYSYIWEDRGVPPRPRNQPKRLPATRPPSEPVSS